MFNTDDDLNYTSRLLVGVGRDSAIQAVPQKRVRAGSRRAARISRKPMLAKKSTGVNHWLGRLATWMTGHGVRATGLPDQAA